MRVVMDFRSAARRAVLLLMVPLLIVTLNAAPAQSSVGCGFDSGVMDVSLNAPGDSATLRRSGSDLLINGADCGATTGNADTIVFQDTTSGSTSVVIDLSNGPMGPGETVEGSGESEIEIEIDLSGGGTTDEVIIVGSADGDQFTLGGSSGIMSFNSDSDADVTLMNGVEERIVLAGGGNDVLDASGGNGTGGSASVDFLLAGESGDDSLVGGDGPDRLTGGTGNDFEQGGLGDDILGQDGISNGADVLEGGPGADTVSYLIRNVPVIASLDGVANDGAPGEGDSIAVDIENLWGGTASDQLAGNEAANTLLGGPGDDALIGGAGGDGLTGGDGTDALDYASSPSGVTLDLAQGTATGGDATGDVIASAEDVVGSGSADAVTGSGGSNSIEGGGGDDSIQGGAGDDSIAGGEGGDELDGGEGIDALDYSAVRTPLSVDLSTGTALAEEATDRLEAFENIIGGTAGDHLIGDAGPNDLRGDQGDDVLEGGPGGDVLDGGDGIDTADYGRSQGGVTVDLAGGTADGGDAQGDELVLVVDQLVSSIENVIGSPQADAIDASFVVNRIEGGGGADEIEGADGRDVLLGNGGEDKLSGAAGKDSLSGGGGADRLNGGSGRDSCNGGPGKDKITACEN